jgi:predicted nucleic acid-binding protein
MAINAEGLVQSLINGENEDKQREWDIAMQLVGTKLMERNTAVGFAIAEVANELDKAVKAGSISKPNADRITTAQGRLFDAHTANVERMMKRRNWSF